LRPGRGATSNDGARLAGVAADASSPLSGERCERLVEASRLATLGRLLPSLLHQLSTPLATVSLRAEGLERASAGAGPEDPAKTKRHLAAIVTEAARCRDLLSLAREFARIPSAERVPVDLNAICPGVARIVFHEAMRRQVEVRLALADGAPAVWGEEDRLRQALLALVLNAVDASPAGGRVEVETHVESGEVVVAVSDAGAGISAEDEPRLGESFYTSRAGGLGLGLMASRAIARAHGGSLAWTARSGGGTTVLLSLPGRRPEPASGA
jgi:two-component system, NtrC family, sensor histidine kinase HydH